MTETPDEKHVRGRAELLPEEETAGSDDPEEQAEQILRESQERTDDPGRTADELPQTSTPDQRPET